jgi:hypothetical protein
MAASFYFKSIKLCYLLPAVLQRCNTTTAVTANKQQENKQTSTIFNALNAFNIFKIYDWLALNIIGTNV